MAGKAGSFKTTLALHMAFAISEGMLVFNKYPTIKSKVLYINEENSKPLFLKIIKRVKKGLGLENSQTNNIAFMFLQGFKLDKLLDQEWLVKWCLENKIEFIVCDSLRRFIDFDENNATDMNKLFENYKIIRKRCKDKITILTLHHLKKENPKSGGDPKDSLRGSSDIVNSSDSVIMVKRKGVCNAIQIEHIKNRAGEEMTNKLIIINSGENHDEAYFYESDKEMDLDKQVSTTDKCAEIILKQFSDKNITKFKKKDIICNFSDSTVKRALAMLLQEGTLTSFGSTTTKQYCINEQFFPESESEFEDENKDEILEEIPEKIPEETE